MSFGYVILNEAGGKILEGETFHACTGVDEKPRRLPEELRKLLERYLAAKIG